MGEDKFARLPGAWKNQKPLLISLTVLLAILLAALVWVLVGRPWVENEYLQRQAAAMLPVHKAELEKLARAPRYTISATVDPLAGYITGQVEVDYTNPSQASLSELVFRLYPNAGTIYGGGQLTVGQVALDGEDLQTELFEQDTALRVLLPQPLGPGRSISLSLAFNAQAPSGFAQGYGIFNRTQEILSLAGWYPLLAVYQDGWQAPPVPLVGDALHAEISLYEVHLSVPAGYAVVSTGAQLETGRAVSTANDSPELTPAGQEWATWHFTSGPAREFAVAIAQDFEFYETQVGGVTLRWVTLPGENSGISGEQALDMLTQAFQVFIDRFGPYPFTEFDLVETPVSIGGYEFSGMVYIHDNARLRSSPASLEYLLAHELAHQWWYGLVGNHTVDEPWLDEAHATYAAVLYFEDTGRPEEGERLVENWSREHGLPEPAARPVNASALEFTDWSAYHKTVYIHGALFLHHLRQRMGEEKFFELLHAYQHTYRYQIMTTTDYMRMAEEVANRYMNSLFREWFQTGRLGSLTFHDKGRSH